jgi:hypothetical protein
MGTYVRYPRWVAVVAGVRGLRREVVVECHGVWKGTGDMVEDVAS